MQRRDFVQTLGAVIAAPIMACAMPRAAASAGGTASRRLKRIGVQLYSLRDPAKANLDRTLADIAEAGYKDVEMLMSMGNFGASPAQARAMLDKHGLRAPSTHMGTRELAALDRAMDEAAILGHEYLFLADTPGPLRKSLDGFRSWADQLNHAGEAARKRDLWIGFHDEAEDFVTIDGQVGYDVLMQRTDPSVVRAQLDIGNAVIGGADPVAYMKKYGDRYWSFHIKDAPAMRAAHDAELGKGIVDVRGVLSLVKNVDDKLVYVEQESYPGAPIDSVRRDYAYLSKLEF
ncbi:MAG TPA: TIM barrel protein [Gemmatimonadaceae bacterium]|jgi:sugar phosphate isomerase/epimerase|nr:TIM barrel protein [Gemmatimonadaceae bacterium]